MVWVLGGLLVGGSIGALMAKRVEMTKMPELVAFLHSMIGLAAVFIAVAAVAEPWAFAITAKGGLIPGGNRVELALGAFIGADHLHRFRHRLRQAQRQVQVPPVPGRAGHLRRPAQAEPGARAGGGALLLRLLAQPEPDGLRSS
jgi:hypothetical protein